MIFFLLGLQKDLNFVILDMIVQNVKLLQCRSSIHRRVNKEILVCLYNTITPNKQNEQNNDGCKKPKSNKKI